MKRNSKILAFIIALAMVMTMVVLPVSAATDVMTDADYVAPTGVNLLDEWGLNYNYDITTTTTTGLYGWNNTTVDANVSGGTRLAGRDPSITKNAGTMTTKSGIGVDGTNGGYANLGATGKQARINYVPFDNEPGTVYKMTVDVKIANETIEEGGTPITSDTLSWSVEGTTNSKNKVVAVSSSGLTVNNTDYTTVTYIFKTAVNKTTGYDRNHAHIGVKTTNATELYLDNWTLEKIGNLLYEKNCGFENGDVTGLSTNLEENVAYWVTSDAARSGSYGFKMTATNNQTDIRYTGLKLTDGAYYRASVWAKLASDNTVENVTSSLIFTRGTVLVSKNPTLRADGWEEITAEFKVNLNGSTNGVNFGPKITSGASVYLDDFSLEQFTPAAFTATLTEGTITTDSAEINVSFSSAPASFTTDNVEVEGATVAVSGSGTSYTISLTDLTEETSYTVALKDVTDVYGQTATGSIAVETEAAPEVVSPAPLSANILAALNKDYDFQNAAVDTTSGVIDIATATANNTFGDTSYVVVDNTTTAAQSGDQCLKITTAASDLNNSYNGCVRFNSLKPPFAIGKYYEISYWAKLADDETATVTAQVHWSRQGSSGMDTTGSKSNAITLTNEWQRVTGYVTFVEKSEASTANAGKAHLGVLLGAESAITKGVYIDNIQVRELVSLINEPDVYAATSVDGTDTYVDVMTIGESASSVYIIAAKYTGNTLTDVKLVPVTATNTESVKPAKFANLTDDYKIFIWDTALKPLCNVFTAGNIQ